MANTSLTLGKHWESFIKEKISNGRYGSASELVRDSLRLLEERDVKLEALRAALIEGEESGTAGKLDIESINVREEKTSNVVTNKKILKKINK